VNDLHVYSVYCLWSGPITAAKRLPGGIPYCPYCGSVLLRIDETKWQRDVAQYEASDPGYSQFVRWIENQPRCFKTLKDAEKVYAEAVKE
jgi:hypothetical protein